MPHLPPECLFQDYILYFEALCFFNKHFGVAITSSKSQDYFPAKWASKNYHEHLDGGVSLKKHHVHHQLFGVSWSISTCAYFSNGLVQPPTGYHQLIPSRCCESMAGSPPFAMTMRSGKLNPWGPWDPNCYLICVYIIYMHVYIYIYIFMMYFLRTDIHSVCICIYIYIYINKYTSNSSDNKNPCEFLLTFPSYSAAGAVSWPRNGIHCSGCSREVFQLMKFLSTFGFSCTTSQRNSNFMFCILRISALFDFFLGPVLWGLQNIDSIAKIYLKKEPPPKKRGLGPYKPMYMGGNINFPRTWYIDWMMFQCVSGGSTLVCIVSCRCCSESWLHWPLNLLNTVSSGNLRVIEDFVYLPFSLCEPNKLLMSKCLNHISFFQGLFSFSLLSEAMDLPPDWMDFPKIQRFSHLLRLEMRIFLDDLHGLWVVSLT